MLVAVGRAPVTEGIGLDTTGAQVDRGYVVADLTTMQTAQPGVYAVGDLLAGTPQLAHAGFNLLIVQAQAAGRRSGLSVHPARGLHPPGNGGGRPHRGSRG